MTLRLTERQARDLARRGAGRGGVSLKQPRKTHDTIMPDTLYQQMVYVRLPEPEREYRFNRPRSQHRFDFAWPDLRVAVEYEGGTWSGGGHVRGSGYDRDCKKYNLAAEQGWIVLRYTAGMVKDGTAIHQIEAVVRAAEGKGTGR